MTKPAKCKDCGKDIDDELLCADCFDKRRGIETTSPTIEEGTTCDRCGAKADSFISGHLFCKKCYKEADRIFDVFVKRKGGFK